MVYGLDDGTAPPAALVIHGMGHLSTPKMHEQSIQLIDVCSPASGPVEGSLDNAEGCGAWQLKSSRFHCSSPGKEVDMMSNMPMATTYCNHGLASDSRAPSVIISLHLGLMSLLFSSVASDMLTSGHQTI